MPRLNLLYKRYYKGRIWSMPESFISDIRLYRHPTNGTTRRILLQPNYTIYLWIILHIKIDHAQNASKQEDIYVL